MKRLSKLLMICLIFNSLQSVSFAGTANNVLLNPGFEDGLTDWEITKNFSEAHEYDKVVSDNDEPRTGSYSLSYYGENAFEFTLTQKVDNLPSGIYTLTMYLEGEADIEGHIGISVKTTDQSITIDNITNEGSGKWQEVKAENIVVDEGKCVVSITVVGGPRYWGRMDDISLVRIGPLPGEELNIVSAEPQMIRCIINDPPKLPSQVTVTYDNGETGTASVVWDNIPSHQYTRLGSFMVDGIVVGSNITCSATIDVEYKSLDLNSDGEISLVDLAEVSYHYGKTRINIGQAQWEQIKHADINNDNEINIHDLKPISNQIIK